MAGVDLRRILSVNLKRLRKRYALAQMDLAEKAGISTNFLSDIERGKKWPYPETLVKLAQALNADVYELFKPEQPPSREINAEIKRYSEFAANFIARALVEFGKNYTSRDE
ncbi:MAG: helix-turn-helix domain-containing protein [Treponema sp.]|jgi:transcriptional regulator with XRE-family HTH domain|nr:helix-turn-helix domain-containing protein [Treponema sp.]